jgi:hypothetical protein
VTCGSRHMWQRSKRRSTPSDSLSEVSSLATRSPRKRLLHKYDTFRRPPFMSGSSPTGYSCSFLLHPHTRFSCPFVMAPEEKVHIKRDAPSVQSDVQHEGPVSVEERRLVRKLDRRILPITCLLYLFACQYLERSMSAFVTHYRNL